MTRQEALNQSYEIAKAGCSDERKRGFIWIQNDAYLRLKRAQGPEVSRLWDDEEAEESRAYWAAKRAKKAA